MNKRDPRRHYGILCGTQTTGTALHVPVDCSASCWYLTGDQPWLLKADR